MARKLNDDADSIPRSRRVAAGANHNGPLCRSLCPLNSAKLPPATLPVNSSGPKSCKAKLRAFGFLCFVTTSQTTNLRLDRKSSPCSDGGKSLAQRRGRRDGSPAISENEARRTSLGGWPGCQPVKKETGRGWSGLKPCMKRRRAQVAHVVKGNPCCFLPASGVRNHARSHSISGPDWSTTIQAVEHAR